MANKINASRNNHQLRNSVVHVIVASALLLSGAIAAADWRIEPTLKAGAEYDDNANLDDRTDQEIDLSGYLLEGILDMAYSSPLTTFSFTPRALMRNYPDNSELESTDVFLASRFNHRMQFSSLGFRVNFDSQTVRTAERADADLDTDDASDITGDDSGRVGLRGDRSKWRFTPNWNYRFSEASSISADIDYFDVSYEDVFLNLLTDYTDARLNLNYRHAFSSRNALLLLVTGRHYESDDDDSTVDGYGAQAGLDRSLSPTTQLRALIGLESADDIGGTHTEVVGQVTLTRRLETISILAEYKRSINASGAGRLSSRDQVNVNFNRRLSEKISAGLGIRAYHSAGIGDTFSIDDRDYVQLRSRFSWYLTSTMIIEADYRYTILDRGDVIGERANSNHVSLWFIYQPNTVAQ